MFLVNVDVDMLAGNLSAWDDEPEEVDDLNWWRNQSTQQIIDMAASDVSALANTASMPLTFVPWTASDASNIADLSSFILDMATWTASDSSNIADSASFLNTIAMLAADTMDLSNTAAMQMIMGWFAENSLNLISVAVVEGEEYEVWSICLDSHEQGNLYPASRYTGFEFNSFITIDGILYGANDNGLHEIGGINDDGANIAAAVQTGKSFIGSEHDKRAFVGYLTAKSNGDMILSVVDQDGTKYSYIAEAMEGTGRRKVKLGRGLKYGLWQFEITNDAGADFELYEASLVPVLLTRRRRR